jgi:hypothetical protein
MQPDSSREDPNGYYCCDTPFGFAKTEELSTSPVIGTNLDCVRIDVP